MKNKNLYIAIFGIAFFYFLLSPIVLASSPTSEMMVTAHVNLGNATCVSWDCHTMPVYFYLPLGTDKPQYVRFIIYPECYGSSLNESEVWSIQMWCINGFNETIDLKQALCKPTEGITRWINLTSDGAVGYFFWNNVQYESYWCAFRRTSDSTNRVPIEFSVLVDTLGLSSFEEDVTWQNQENALTKMQMGIREIFTVNFNVLQILFYLVSSILIIIGFIAIIGLIPLMIKWIMKRVSK